MNKSTFGLILLLIGLAGLTGFNYFFKPFEVTSGPELAASPQPSASSLPAQENVLNQLSPEQRIAQTLAVGTILKNGDETAKIFDELDVDPAWAAANQPGMVIFFGKDLNVTTAKLATTDFHSIVMPIKIAIGVDHEGGTVQRLNGEGFSKLESWQKFCSFEVTTRRGLLERAAKELKEVGVNVVLGPVVDYSTLSNPVLKTRLCDANPLVVMSRSAEAVEQYSLAGITPVIKHFPGIGDVSKDLHKNFAATDVTQQNAEIYRQILDRFPNIGVMVSHAGVKNQYENVPCSLSSTCVNQLQQAYPQALRITDDLTMAAAAQNAEDEANPLTLSQRVVKAILAGNDLALIGPSVNEEELNDLLTQLSALYKQDKNFAKAVDESTKRVIEWKINSKL